MITSELIARINELARKKRKEGLTEKETAEQKKLYEIYLSSIRGQVTNLLDSVEFVEPDGTKTKPAKKKHFKQAMISLERVYH